MSSFRIEVPDSDSIDLLERYPDEAKVYLVEGLATLTQLSDNDYSELISEFIQSISPSGKGTGPNLAPRFGLNQEQARSLTMAISFVLFSIAFGSRTAEQVLESASKGLQLETATKLALSRFTKAAEDNRSKLKSAFNLTRLGSEVLPSLVEFETTIDLRLGFDDAKVASSVPVVVVHLITDSEQEEVWFQITQGQLERLLDDLKRALDQVRAAEEWAKTK